MVVEEMEAFFELEVERKIVGKALRAGCAEELLLVGESAERESGAGFEGVGDFELVNDREIEEGKVSPGEEAVGGVPGIGTGFLRAEDRIVDAEVEDLIGAGTGASVGAHQHVAFAEVVAEGDLEAVVAVVTGVLEDEVAARSVVESVVDESVIAAALLELGFHVDGIGEFLFEGNAPVEEARNFERAAVDGEGGGDGAGGGDASGADCAIGIDGVEEVLPRAGVGAGDQVDGRAVIDEADSGGDFGVAGGVEDIGSGEAGRERKVADDGVAVEADARFEEQAVGDAPAIFGVDAEFGVVLLVQGSGAEGGVAGAGES